MGEPQRRAVPAAACTVVVTCAVEALAGTCVDIGHLVRAGTGARTVVDTRRFAPAEDDADLLILVVAAADVAAALDRLAALRVGRAGRAALVAAIELDDGEIENLLAAGACDFLHLPVAPQELAVRVHRALGLCQGKASPTPRPSHPALRDLIGNSPPFARQVARLPVFAKYDASVLILGETGTGKEVCAQAIHYLSVRSGRPWVAVNCGAIPTELVEAELFGHVKGAYTHAHGSRAGLVREAEGGTLFLDEIDALPYGAQAKLLRFLQDKEYRAVGSNQVVRADVRVIAATSRDPASLAARGAFRQDLLFRLNVLALHLPLLRDRQADIPALAAYFMRGAALHWQKEPVPSLTPAALQKLIGHAWPGNVRELKNVMERAVLMSTSAALGAHDIELDGVADDAAGIPADESLRAAKGRLVENFERAYVQQLLASNAGNVTHAARAAKKNRRAFFELMRKYNIASGTYRDAALPE